jgi:hypothetical protein
VYSRPSWIPCSHCNGHVNSAEWAAVRLKRLHRNSRATAADKVEACTSLLRRLVMRETVNGGGSGIAHSPWSPSCGQWRCRLSTFWVLLTLDGPRSSPRHGSTKPPSMKLQSTVHMTIAGASHRTQNHQATTLAIRRCDLAGYQRLRCRTF